MWIIIFQSINIYFLRDGLELSRDLGITHFLVELDAKELVMLLNNEHSPNLLIRSIVSYYRNISQAFHSFKTNTTSEKHIRELMPQLKECIPKWLILFCMRLALPIFYFLQILITLTSQCCRVCLLSFDLFLFKQKLAKCHNKMTSCSIKLIKNLELARPESQSYPYMIENADKAISLMQL